MVLLIIAVVAGVSAVVAGAVSGGLEEPASPIPARALPDEPLTGKDVADLRFVQAFRGYRMDQVDVAMDRLAAEVDRLRALLPEGADEAAGFAGADGFGSGAAPVSGAALSRPTTDLADGTDGTAGPGEEVLDAEVMTAENATLPAGWPAGRD
jgi:DivIVA domain-containing protein